MVFERMFRFFIVMFVGFMWVAKPQTHEGVIEEAEFDIRVS
jgi:hypothetical protein